MTMIDVLSYMTPAANFAANYHLESSQPGVNPQYFFRQPVDNQSGWLYYMKNRAGFPWDINWYDTNYVYQCITEGPEGWTDPSSYKAFASTSWPGNHGGIVWSPRYLQPLPFVGFRLTADTTYNTYLGGQLVNVQDLGGPAQVLVQGPYQLSLGGNLGQQNVLIQTYQWGPGYATQEQNWYAFGLGIVRWQEYDLVNGVYQLKIDNIFNQKAVGGGIAPDFPNPLP